MPTRVAEFDGEPRCIDVIIGPGSLFKRPVMFDGDIETIAFEQMSHLIEAAIYVMQFKYDLIDLIPIILADSGEHIELTLLHVNLQQINPLNTILSDDVGNSRQPDFRRLAVKLIIQKLFQKFRPARDLGLLVTNERSDDLLLIIQIS